MDRSENIFFIILSEVTQTQKIITVCYLPSTNYSLYVFECL